MSEDQLRREIMSCDTTNIEMPDFYWEYLLKVLEHLCMQALSKIDSLSTDVIEILAEQKEVQDELANPFFIRAFIVERMLEKGLVSEEFAGERDLNWVKGIFDMGEEFYSVTGTIQ